MFTGIIQELGTVENIRMMGNIYRLRIRSNSVSKDVKIGDSVSVNGACLTVVARDNRILSFDVMPESARKTKIASLKDGDRVNLEGSLKAGGTLDGHFVLGHVDCIGKISDIRKAGGEFAIRVNFSEGFDHLVVEKGSITVDGVSLTISDTKKGEFSVYIIPHTLSSTTLSLKSAGDAVNLEFDILGKYVAKNMNSARQSRLTEEFLRSHGF